MDKIKSINTEAYSHLIERDPNTWSRACFEVDRACESVENGISESFNSVILSARRKPIITMLEEIRMFLMERNYNMSKKSQKWDGKIRPAIRKKIKDWSKNSSFVAIVLLILQLSWIVIPSGDSGDNAFEVRNVYEAYTVDLDNRECSCKLWQISGLPCLHSVSAIYYIYSDPEDYVSDWFRVEKFKETYTHYMKPFNGSKMWKSIPYIQPLPPKERRMQGRLSIKRKRHKTKKQGKYKKVSTNGRYMTCSNCLEKGHNIKTCTNEKKTKSPKEPKKTPEA
ncbi:uncharacterized protein LOC143583616 [Bidens hawaiensis]|uniref:uncharacterized protein LOC143583616 n=1 Tax=Bidens hawaiensis TaxID=980011 RepID=UPI004049F5C8